MVLIWLHVVLDKAHNYSSYQKQVQLPGNITVLYDSSPCRCEFKACKIFLGSIPPNLDATASEYHMKGDDRISSDLTIKKCA